MKRKQSPAQRAATERRMRLRQASGNVYSSCESFREAAAEYALSLLEPPSSPVQINALWIAVRDCYLHWQRRKRELAEMSGPRYVLWNRRPPEFLGEHTASIVWIQYLAPRPPGQEIPLGTIWIEPSGDYIEGPPDAWWSGSRAWWEPRR